MLAFGLEHRDSFERLLTLRVHRDGTVERGALLASGRPVWVREEAGQEP